jgi:hypothetical protein
MTMTTATKFERGCQDVLYRLSVKLSDGRELSGVYNWIGAWERIEQTENQGSVESYTLDAVVDERAARA